MHKKLPIKQKELRRLLLRAGFVEEKGGAHITYWHPRLNKKVSLSRGTKDGDAISGYVPRKALNLIEEADQLEQ